MPELINTERFLELAQSYPVLDVRSPMEFNHASYPGAVSFPLMNDEERAIIGTIFKKEGRASAVVKGYELIGGKFADFLKAAIEKFPERKVVMYCWRGGLRSNIMAFLFESAGFRVMLLKGGYKMLRKRVLEILDQPLPMLILGGMTGSGKTKILKALSDLGEQTIDLENLACHKGSAFGALGEPSQPGYEYFENLLALKIFNLKGKGRVWVENESRMIGKVKIPDNFFRQMREARVIEVYVPKEERVKEIEKNYGRFDVALLLDCTRKLNKKLGDLRTNQACELLISGDVKGWISMLLDYYDENYQYSSSQRLPSTINNFSFEKIDPVLIAKHLKENNH